MTDNEHKSTCKYQCKKQNTLLDKLVGFRIQGETRQVFDLIVRKSVGWDKRTDMISLSQFELYTGLRKPNICRALDALESHRIIITYENDDIKAYGINQNYSEWVPLSNPRKLSNMKKDVIKEENPTLSDTSTTKKTETKETYTKKSIFLKKEYTDIAEYFRDKTIQNNSKAVITEKQIMSWAKTAMFMVEKDGILFDDIYAVINWCKNPGGNYWSPLIDSMQKLREKWNTLSEMMMRKNPKTVGEPQINWDEVEDHGKL